MSLLNWQTVYTHLRGKLRKSKLWSLEPDDLVLSFSAATVHGDALRLVSRGNDSVMRSCTWPSRMEVNRSGTYRITVSASKFKPIKDEPMELEIRAREVAASDRTHVGSFRF